MVQRERRFAARFEADMRRGERCLIPVFALGRTQKLLLFLDEHFLRSHPDLQDIPSPQSLLRRCVLYQTCMNVMNDYHLP
ncbi:hypothetical protein KXD40_007709 [Peronospora effusa]|nr:hypothetical protein KXD40_007709 [Peronospora effusa]